MPAQTLKPDRSNHSDWRGTTVPIRIIRRYARQIAKRFEPEKITLFGSHTYGTPHADSDVEILMVMPASYELGQAFKIRLALPAPFPMDLLVRTPKNLRRLFDEGESFTTEMLTKGKVIYEQGNLMVTS